MIEIKTVGELKEVLKSIPDWLQIVTGYDEGGLSIGAKIEERDLELYIVSPILLSELLN
jgi:hypothetical protein